MMYILMIGICFILILFSYDYASAPIVLLVIIIAILFKYYSTKYTTKNELN